MSTPNRSGQWAAGAAAGVLPLLFERGRGALEVLQVLLSVSVVLHQREALLNRPCQQVQELLRLCEVQLRVLLQGEGGRVTPLQVQ